MMQDRNGRLAVRIAGTPSEVERAQALRHLCFRGGVGVDADGHDAQCRHVLVEDRQSGVLQACFRLLPLASGAAIQRSYAAQHYDLSALAGFAGPMLELGRFCIRPGLRDPDILRVAWAEVTRQVDSAGVGMLFGCSSFRGTGADAYRDAFALLRARHLAPGRWRPGVKAAQVFAFAQRLAGHRPDLRQAQRTMPPLLRTYLAMGGWVSDHAVVDRDLGTLHVFTAVEIGAIPANRARLLRADAGGGVAAARVVADAAADVAAGVAAGIASGVSCSMAGPCGELPAP